MNVLRKLCLSGESGCDLEEGRKCSRDLKGMNGGRGLRIP